MEQSDGQKKSIGQGLISYSSYEAYPWKNELAEQKSRVLKHLAEIQTDATTEHNPHHMIFRSISVAAICMRRLLECRLVTDQFSSKKLGVFKIPAKPNSNGIKPYFSMSGGRVSENYQLDGRIPAEALPRDISNKLLHARIIATLAGNSSIPDGLLIASDHQLGDSLLHFTPHEFGAICDAFLDDHVSVSADRINTETGEVFATRE